MIEVNLIKKLNSSYNPLIYLIKNKTKIKLLKCQYYNIPKNLPNECIEIFKRLKKIPNIKSCVFFPIANENDVQLRAVVIYDTQEDLYCPQIKNFQEYIISVKNFIKKFFNIPVIDTHFKGYLKIEPDMNFEGNSYSLAVWLAIFFTFFNKPLNIKFAASGIINLENFTIEPVKFIDKKIVPIEQELEEEKIKIYFFYNGEQNYNKYTKISKISDIFRNINLKINYKSFLNLSIDEYLSLYKNFTLNKDYEKAFELGNFLLENYKEKLNTLPYKTFKFKILSTNAHYYTNIGEILKAKKIYEQIISSNIFKNLSQETRVDFLTKYINFYIDLFDLEKVKEVLEQIKKDKYGDIEYKFLNLYGNYFELIKDYKLAEQYYNKSIEYSKEKEIYRTKNYLLRVYIKQNKFDKVKNNFKYIFEIEQLNLISENDISYIIFYILKYLYFSNESNKYTNLLKFIENKIFSLKNNYMIGLSLYLLYKIKKDKIFLEEFEKIYNKFYNKKNAISFLYEIFYLYFQNIDLNTYKDKLFSHPYEKISNFQEFFLKINPSKKIDVFNSVIWF